MDLLYKSSFVDIFFDRKKNLLVQKWKNGGSHMELIYGPKSDKGLTFHLNGIVTTQLYDCPNEDFESELEIMLYQFYPGILAKA
ncbi:MAG: hypothetical protein HC831_22145 [Chloroflexia bacterium]|nr:hypothetical protein [Chloroflexia bacterium]